MTQLDDLTNAVLDDDTEDTTTLDDLDQENTWTGSVSSSAASSDTRTENSWATLGARGADSFGLTTTSSDLYAAHAPAYWAAGWHAVLPLPPRHKASPPNGYTGREGTDPSYADVQAWTEDYSDGNIALRLPRGVLGIDVDNYGDKGGLAALEALEARHGALPPTWSSSSRTDGSGIRLFRVPEGLHWPGGLGPGIDVIQYRHRYVVAPPSIHPNGGTYRWTAYGTVVDEIPTLDELSWLPEPWVLALTNGQTENTLHRAGLTQDGKHAWLDARLDGTPCERMTQAAARWTQKLLTSGESRHDTAVLATRNIIGMAGEGHPGSGDALDKVIRAFNLAIDKDPTRDTDDSEIARMIEGAVDLSAHEHPGPPNSDPCDLTDAVLEDTWTSTTAAPASPAVTTTASSTGTTPTSSASGGSAGAAAASTANGTPTDSLEEHPDLSSAVLDDTDQEDTWTPSTGSTPTPSKAPSLTSATTDGTPSASTRSTSGGSPTAGTPTPSSAGATVTSSPDDARDAARWRLWQDAEHAGLLEEYQRQSRQRRARTMLDDEEHTATWRVPPTYGTLADELALPEEPVQWRVHDLLPAGGNVLLTAQFKAGKTSLVNSLVHSLVDGAPFLGSFAVERPRRVAVFNYEVGEQQYRRWLREIGIVNATAVSMLHLRGSRLPITTPRVEDWVVDWLGEREIDVWVVDPFARAFVGCGVSENDNTEVSRFLDTLDVIKDRAGVSELILPAHTGRAIADEGQERARGATRLDDWADVRWMLNRGKGEDEDTRYLRATGRDVDIPEGELSYDESTRRMSFVSGKGRKGKAGRDMGKAILEFIENNPGCSMNKIDQGVTGKREAVREVLERLVLSGFVARRTGSTGGWAHYRGDVRRSLQDGVL